MTPMPACRLLLMMLLMPACLLLTGCSLAPTAAQYAAADRAAYRINAALHDPGLWLWDGSWNAITVASDGNVYFGLSTHSLDGGAIFARFNPNADVHPFHVLGDMNKVTRTRVGANNGAIPQGKIHTPLLEHEGQLYFATHLAPVSERFFAMREPYPGGAFVRYDIAEETFEVIARAPEGEGVVTLTANFERDEIYALTWPTGDFLVVDLNDGEVRNLGQTENEWTRIEGRIDYVETNRTLAIDPATDRVFGTRLDGKMYVYDPDTGELKFVELSTAAGVVGPASEAAIANSTWRTVVYDKQTRSFYGTHRGTTSLFRFDPAAMTITPIVRLSPRALHDAEDSSRSSRLAMVLTRDRVIYHVSLGEQVEIEGRPTGKYQLYLVSYDLKTGTLRDHGPIFTEGRRALWSDSAALDETGNTLWLLADVEVTDPVTTWQLNNIRRGLGANHTLGGNLFEMQLLEIPLE